MSEMLIAEVITKPDSPCLPHLGDMIQRYDNKNKINYGQKELPGCML